MKEDETKQHYSETEHSGGEPEKHLDPNEEEQLRLMQEQQAEIDQLKAQLVSNQPMKQSENEVVSIPDPEQLAMSFQETVWPKNVIIL